MLDMTGQYTVVGRHSLHGKVVTLLRISHWSEWDEPVWEVQYNNECYDIHECDLQQIARFDWSMVGF